MTYDAWLSTTPESDDHDICSSAGCGKRATIDLTKTIHACSTECEEELAAMFCAGGCGANLADGDDCGCAEPVRHVWEEAS